MSVTIKSCWQCKHLSYTRGREGEPYYSEDTPGGAGELPELLCRQGHFAVDFEVDQEEDFRRKILSAETCADFEDRGKK